MTLPSRHRIRNSSPDGLRPSTLTFAYGGSPQYWIFTSERRRNILSPSKLEGQSGVWTPLYLKHDALARCWSNVDPPSTTSARNRPNIGLMPRVCWAVTQTSDGCDLLILRGRRVLWSEERIGFREARLLFSTHPAGTRQQTNVGFNVGPTSHLDVILSTLPCGGYCE